jgi:hypothetical protein
MKSDHNKHLKTLTVIQLSGAYKIDKIMEINLLYNNFVIEFVQPKMSLNNRVSGKREGGGERERGVGGKVSRQAYLKLA